MSIFEDQFWGDKNSGYDVLLQSLNYGKDSSKELADFLKQRATLEDLYSKGLHKVAKFALGHNDSGTFYPLWKVVGEEVEKECTTHSEMSRKLGELSSQVAAYCHVQEKKYSTTLDSLSSTHEAVKSINRLTEEVYKAEEKYISKCFDKEKLAKTSTKSSGKDVEKAETVVRKTMDEYRMVIDRYGKSKNVFVEKFASATDKFQDLETGHLENMKGYLDQYIDVIEEGLSYDYQATIDFKEHQTQWSVDQLLSEFVRVKHTGEERPTEMEQVVFDGDTAAPRKEDHDKDKTKSPVQNDEYYKEMIQKIVPPPPPDDQLLVNQKDSKKGFLKRMKKERRSKKKQRHSSNTSSADSTSLKSPMTSSMGGQSATSVANEFDYNSAAVQSYNRNTSVDSEGYSLKPNEEMNNRESGTSFYSSSEDESADEETNKFNSSSGSTLKFSIRPPSVNLAPSMDDLSTTAKNLTLEKSPRMPRKGLSTEVNNDSSASLSTMNTEDKSYGGASKQEPKLVNDFDSPSSFRMPDIPGGAMGSFGIGSITMDNNYGQMGATNYDQYSYGGAQSSYQQPYTESSYGSPDYVYSENDASPMAYEGYTSGAVSNESYYSSDVQNAAVYNQNVDAHSYYSAQARDSYEPNSSDEDDAGYIPPPSIPPPKLPPSIANALTAIETKPAPVESNTPSSYAYASNSYNNNTTQNNEKFAQSEHVYAPNSYNNSNSVSYETSTSKQVTETVGSGSVATSNDFDAFQPRERSSSVDSNSSMMFSNVPANSSRGPSPLTVGTSESVPIAVAFSETVHAVVYSKLPPSSWQVKVNGTMAVSFPAGFVQLLTQSTKYLDELRFSVLNSGQLTRAVVNSDIVQSSCEGVYQSHVEYTFKMDELKVELMKQHSQKPTSSFFNIEVLKYQIDALAYHQNYLPLLLKAEYLNSTHKQQNSDMPAAMLTSSSSEDEDYLSSLSQHCLRVTFEYNHDCVCNNSSVVAAKPLLNVNVLAKLQNDVDESLSVHVSKVEPSPLLNENGKIVWKIGAISVNSDRSELSVQWLSSPLTNLNNQNSPFGTDQNVSPQPAVAAQFSCEGQLLSGLEFDLISSGYRVSLYKQKIQAGKYLCHC